MLQHTKKIKFSLEPIDSVALNDFDFDIQISPEYLGAESNQVKVTGIATLRDGTEAAFTAPILALKLQYQLTS